MTISPGAGYMVGSLATEGVNRCSEWREIQL